MSSLIFLTEATQAIVATDTLAVRPGGTPLKFTSKALYLPHLRTIFAGTGLGGFLDRWFLIANSVLAVRGIDNLAFHTSGYLASIWGSYKEEFTNLGDRTTTVYHIGISESTGQVQAMAFRSENDFKPELLQYGLHYKPQCSVPDEPRLPEDFGPMMEDQRHFQEEQPESQRVYIGGEIQVYHLTREGCSIYPMGKFHDFDDHEKAIYAAFNKRG